MAHSYTSRFTQLPAVPTPRYPYNSSSTTQAQTSQQSSRYHRPQPPAVPSYKTHIYSPSDYSTPGLSPSLPPSRPHSLHLRRSQEPEQREQREQRERKRDSRSSRENLHSSVSVKDLPDLGEVDLMDGKNATRPTRFIASIACPPRRRPSEEQTSRRTSGPATDSGSGSDNSKVTKRKDRRSGTDSTPSP